jgi:hypothetical protein
MKPPLPSAQRLAGNREAAENYIKIVYPNEKFLSTTAELQAMNKWSKGLTLPGNVKVAESRIPVNSDQRGILKKELKQAGILSRLGCFIYLIPERSAYGERPKDAVVNGKLFEFRTVTGNARTFEWEFRGAKKKGKDTNVFVNIESNISMAEARRKIGLVLKDHPEYTGEIIISLKGEKTCFWDTGGLK